MDVKHECRHSTKQPVAGQCKICGSTTLKIFAHTANCGECGILLNYPYAPVREEDFLARPALGAEEHAKVQATWKKWYVRSGERNHWNFSSMALFALDEQDRQCNLDVLDFGGGGGQFALVMRSLFPLSTTSIVDMQDDALLDQNNGINNQILFKDFERDTKKFDIIFMNDVYEHVTDPIGILSQLRSKLKPAGRIFIDTPCVFWLYYTLKPVLPGLQAKVLRGTVDHDHQQIWSTKSFAISANRAGLAVEKIKFLSEYTQGADFYLNNMGVRSPLLRMAGHIFIAAAPYIARNKIMAVLRAVE
jgi:2-polyprenyl-3-methyl-5-hydroxy-6-metoxy-1,4-benzoquinol methylase